MRHVSDRATDVPGSGLPANGAGLPTAGSNEAHGTPSARETVVGNGCGGASVQACGGGFSEPIRRIRSQFRKRAFAHRPGVPIT
jgi:hypothetical protein